MKILIASDHAGFELKGILSGYLEGLGHTVVDYGPKEFNEVDDYPDFMIPVAKDISAHSDEWKAILIGGSGQGEAMTANRFLGVRAAVYYGGSEDIIKLSREHNNANVLSFGARFVKPDEAKTALKLWLDTPFTGEERHVRRLKKIDSALSGVCLPKF